MICGCLQPESVEQQLNRVSEVSSTTHMCVQELAVRFAKQANMEQYKLFF